MEFVLYIAFQDLFLRCEMGDEKELEVLWSLILFVSAEGQNAARCSPFESAIYAFAKYTHM